jgi:hypothetical protein
MIPELIVGTALACVVGVPLALVGAALARRDTGTRRIPRPHPLAILARDLLGLLPPAPAGWAAIRAGMGRPPRYADTSRTLAEMCGPIVTDDEVAEEWSLRPLSREGIREQWDRASVPMSPDPAVKPGVGWQVPDDWRLPGGRGLMFVRPNKQPWSTASMPAIRVGVPEKMPTPQSHYCDSGNCEVCGDGTGDEPVPLARPYAPSPTYGEACELDVAEAERLAEAMRP